MTLPTLTPTTTVSEVAFFAYMSHPLTNPSGQHILKFDVSKLNVGNAYHLHTGVFNPPTSGIYVMALECEDKRIAVVHANKCDDVYVRIKTDTHSGDVWSDTYGRSTFAGWKIY
ncbi:heavy metal-binding protein HIP-like [Mytilus trossulus]|uniref:heavy metal-binding protein HIP-like n=1 Tax=Mytilus trossulus TaxID=6551 RepID=UPI003005D26D